MQIKKNEAIFEDLVGYAVSDTKRDQGLIVTFVGDRNTRMIEIDRNAVVETLGAASNPSRELIERNRTIFNSLIGCVVEAVVANGEHLNVLFLEGENPKGILIDRDAKITAKPR